MFHVPNQFRLRTGKLGSTDEIGNAGFFIIPSPKQGRSLCIIASDGGVGSMSASMPKCPGTLPQRLFGMRWFLSRICFGARMM